MATKSKGYPVPETIEPATEICYQIPVPNDPAYLRAFFGQLSELGAWGMWEKEPTHKATLTAKYWRGVYARITTCGEVFPCPDSEFCCQVLAPTSGLIEYAPNDPYRTPDTVPAGYLLPPWTLDDERPATGLTSLPIGIFNPIAILSGFPRFKVRCKGNGKALLYLRKVPNGGYAYITVDGNPAGMFVDMASWSIVDFESWTDFLAPIIGTITGSSYPLEIVEVQLEGSGDHYIDVTCLPKLGGLTVLQGMGLQLERVELCTDEIAIEPEEEMNEFRVVDCIFQWRPNSEAAWTDLVDLTTCVPPIEPPPAGTDDVENIDWYCRAALVVAEELLSQGEPEVARVEGSESTIGLSSYGFDYMLPASVRPDTYYVENQGAWGAVTGTAIENFQIAMGNTEQREWILIYLRHWLECLFKSPDHAATDYLWEPIEDDTFAGNIQASESHVLVMPADMSEFDLPNKMQDFARGLFAWLKPYPNLNFDIWQQAINFEANLSPKYGVVECLVADCSTPSEPLEPCPEMTALGITASSSFPGFSPANVLIDDSSRWSSATETGDHWLQYQYETPVSVGSVQIKVIPDFFVPMDLGIEYQDGTETWIEVARETTSSADHTIAVETPPPAAVKWRVRDHSNYWMDIQYLHFECYGE